MEKKKPCIIRDTRESTPWDFSPLIGDDWTVEDGTLTHADYSVKGLTDMISLERKSREDMIQCCGSQRDRFVRELLALRGYKCRAVIIECNLADIVKGGWRGLVTPAQVLGSIASFRVRYQIEFIYGGSHELACAEAFRLIRKYHEYCQDWSKRFNI